jgi:hypothetical protein
MPRLPAAADKTGERRVFERQARHIGLFDKPNCRLFVSTDDHLVFDDFCLWKGAPHITPLVNDPSSSGDDGAAARTGGAPDIIAPGRGEAVSSSGDYPSGSTGRGSSWRNLGSCGPRTNYARLMRDQGRAHEARDLLARVYAWFTEGFDAKESLGARIVALANPSRLQQRDIAHPVPVGAALQTTWPNCAFCRRRANHADLIGIFILGRVVDDFQAAVGAGADFERVARRVFGRPLAGFAVLRDATQDHRRAALLVSGVGARDAAERAGS